MSIQLKGEVTTMEDCIKTYILGMMDVIKNDIDFLDQVTKRQIFPQPDSPLLLKHLDFEVFRIKIFEIIYEVIQSVEVEKEGVYELKNDVIYFPILAKMNISELFSFFIKVWDDNFTEIETWVNEKILDDVIVCKRDRYDQDRLIRQMNHRQFECFMKDQDFEKREKKERKRKREDEDEEYQPPKKKVRSYKKVLRIYQYKLSVQ